MWGFNLTDTKTIKVGGLHWTVGVIPDGKLAEITDAVRESLRPLAELREQISRETPALDADAAASVRAAATGLRDRVDRDCERAMSEFVRWGLRGWEGSGVLPTEEATYEGDRFAVLPARLVSALRRSPLFIELCSEIRRAQELTADDLRGFSLPPS